MIQKKSLKDAIQNPEIISVVGELLDVDNKIPIKFPITSEQFTGTNWVHLTTIKNNGAFARVSSIMQVQFGRYGTDRQSVLLLGIAHSTICIPYVIALSVKNKVDVGLKLAYLTNDSNNTTSIYITTNLSNGAINKMWVTKYIGLSIVNDDLSKTETLPSGAVKIEV